MTERRIEVDGVVWRYRVGRNYVKFTGPRTFVVGAATVKGLSSEAWEKGCWKKTSDGMVCPSDIARYLRTQEAS